MPTATLAPADLVRKLSVCLFQAADAAAPVIKLSKNSDGTAWARGVHIFKVGTFRDSMGDQHTWTAEHLAQMVFNFQMLGSQGLFVDVPWREDHSGSVKSVCGYIRGLAFNAPYLDADVLFTEPSVIEKIVRGTYRARSSEIGFYNTNDEALHWPVVMGCAFVDIGAVENLYSAATADYTGMIEEAPVADKTDTTGAEAPPAGGGAPAPAPTTEGGGGAAPATPPATPTNGGTSDHGRPVATQVFTINGAPTSDYAAVQAHIATLEGFRKETIENGRTNFVKALSDGKKIAASQVEALTEVALGMDDAAFAKFKAAYEGAPEHTLLANHAGADADAAGGNGQPAEENDEVAILQAQIDMHRRSHVPQEQIEKMASFKRLQALTAKAN